MSDTMLHVEERPGNVPADRVVDFNLFDPIRGDADLHSAWKRLQNSTDVSMVWTPHNGGHWIALRGRLVEEIMMDTTRFTSHTVLVPKATAGAAYRFYPLSLDPPEQRPYRSLMNKKLMAKSINPMEDHVRELTVELIEGFRAKGRCNFIHEFSEVLPLRVFMGMVNLPLSDLPRLKFLADQYTRPDGTMELHEVTAEFMTYLKPVMVARRGKGLDDLLSTFVDGQIGDRPITDEEASNLAVQVLVGGLDTVLNFMGFVMLFLAENPDVRRTLRQSPEKIPHAVLEFLRRFPIVADAREVVADITFEGIELKQGDMVLAPTVLHGLDDEQFTCPMEVRIDRPVSKLTSFGKGVHVCPGQHLARMEMKVLLEEWLTRIPEFSVEPGSVIKYAGGIDLTVLPYILVWDVNAQREAA